MEKIILQKFIAESGHCSRRQAEELVRSGKVTVNGEPAELGQRVGADDSVEVSGKMVKPAGEKIYILLNKPKGYVCTNRKFKGEKSVFELLPEKYCHLQIAGRLDKNSRGLVLFTNDGEFNLRMTHPRYSHEKEYLIEVKGERQKTKASGRVESNFLKGIDIGEGDGVVRAKKIEDLHSGKYRVILTEGRKRQVRRMFEALGLEVADLMRARIGKLKLGDLEEGKWKIIEI